MGYTATTPPCNRAGRDKDEDNRQVAVLRCLTFPSLNGCRKNVIALFLPQGIYRECLPWGIYEEYVGDTSHGLVFTWSCLWQVRPGLPGWLPGI